MKEMTKNQVCEIANQHTEAGLWNPSMVTDGDMQFYNHIYRLGQHEAQPDRAMIAAKMMAACRAVYSGLTSEQIAEQAICDTDALIAELNRTAEKGGEG